MYFAQYKYSIIIIIIIIIDWWIYLANVTVRLQVSDYKPTQWLEKDKAVYATIKFEEIVMGMIKDSTVHSSEL